MFPDCSLSRMLRPLCATLLLTGAAIAPGLQGADEVLTPFTADHSEHDFTTGLHHLMGNVDINVPGLMRLQCDDFRGLVPASSTEATNAVMTAAGQVRLHLTSKPKGTNAPVQLLAMADQAVYTGTNEMFVLTGNPKVVSAFGTLTGSIIRYDVGANKAFAENYRFVPNATLLTNLLDRARQKTSPGGSGSK